MSLFILQWYGSAIDLRRNPQMLSRLQMSKWKKKPKPPKQSIATL